MLFLSHWQISELAELSSGTVPLEIEMEGSSWAEDRICNVCNNNQIENENHFFAMHNEHYELLFIPYYGLSLCDIQVCDLQMEINQANGDQSVLHHNGHSL